MKIERVIVDTRSLNVIDNSSVYNQVTHTMI